MSGCSLGFVMLGATGAGRGLTSVRSATISGGRAGAAPGFGPPGAWAEADDTSQPHTTSAGSQERRNREPSTMKPSLVWRLHVQIRPFGRRVA